ncbi:glycosyltransferase [Heterostelium album PN500]|uniref:Mannosyltransferase n=1 Tax=Heterostelium pallidum (strain ATCC 26659 / Pp 5 / PN500) TaxID=670386 RepID=D3B0B5_HETP5|nr:glycosyltransferase [Heterostelium album PN500]EFA84739.1 glycosyltransferase [Heterostelium album PN500]|eukprot:XP_020436851.1 glycosyltransferase [Heterostelium album PN500]
MSTNVRSRKSTTTTSKDSNSGGSTNKTTNIKKPSTLLDLLDGSSEIAIYFLMFIYVYICPYTKVEESFNLQAMHDILIHRFNINNYDHLEFPGVIPRTFIGALFVSVLSSPFQYVVEYFGGSKLCMLYVVRAVLGFIGVTALIRLKRSIARKFGLEVAVCFALVVISQFHLLFYISRPLPNVFALSLVVLAYAYWLDNRSTVSISLLTVAIFIFRSEVLILAGPVTLSMLIGKRLKFTNLLVVGVVTALLSVGVSVLIDSYFWQRTIYPEMEVLLFNTVENRSHEWGVSPFHWYFSSALPRALLLWLPLAFLSMLVDRRALEYLLPILLFVFLYSFLPHKELRFIFYALPIFSLGSAITIARIFKQFNKSFIYKLVSIGMIGIFGANLVLSSFFFHASSLNYPGGEAFNQLHQLHSECLEQPLNVHIDNIAAITGVSRFGEISQNWNYSKKERDVLLSDYDLLLAPNATSGFDVAGSISGFTRFQLLRTPPFIQVVKEPQIYIMTSKQLPLKCPKLNSKYHITHDPCGFVKAIAFCRGHKCIKLLIVFKCMNIKLCFLFVVISTFSLLGNSEIFKGAILSSDSWYLIDKFCFTEDDATVNVKVDFRNNPNATLLLYSDLDTVWGKISTGDLTCHERVMAASSQVNSVSGLNGKTVSVDQRRARWWYFAIANCDQNTGSHYQIDIPYYEIRANNDGDSFNSLISADQQGIPQSEIAFILFFLALLIFSIVSIVFLWHRNLESKVMKLFSIVLFFKILALFVCLIYWAMFLRYESGHKDINLAGTSLDLIARALFILLLLLVGQGWTISPFYGNVVSRVINVIMFVVILVMSVAIYLVPNVTFMPSKMYTFFYDTIPGYILLAFFLTIMIWFIVLCRNSYVKQVDIVKKKFFLYFGLIFTFWFLMMPVSVLVSHFLESWVRQKTVVIFNLVVDSIFYSIIAFLFRASKSNPYVHILNMDQKEKGVRLQENGAGGELQQA